MSRLYLKKTDLYVRAKKTEMSMIHQQGLRHKTSYAFKAYDNYVKIHHKIIKSTYVKNISIKLKLLILSTASLTILSSILGIVSINKIENTLIEQEYKRLTAARDSKIKQLETIFALYKKQINLLKDTSYVKELSTQFGNIYKSIGTDPYGKFPIDHEQVQKALPKWDAFYKRYTDTYPFDDVLILSQKLGHVVYSYGKKNDFGTNVMYGEFRNSNLAQLWKKGVILTIKP